ncbi:MAG TPA: hypothetical protein PLP21_09000 [Pyrinomonadaceae bacterium]|nr:hypothetical protein [Pyrinomonadaceae bacterium]
MHFHKLAAFEKALEADPNYKSPQTNLAKLKEQMAGGSTGAPASISAGYFQLDFPSHFSHGRKEPRFLEGGIPVSGYNGGESPMVWLAKCKTPNGDGICYPTHLDWSVPGYQSSGIMLSTNLSWWGDQLQGKPAFRLTVEGRLVIERSLVRLRWAAPFFQ